MRLRALCPALLLAGLLWGVQPAGAAPLLPPPNAGFDPQLGGAYPPLPGVEMVSRDRLEAPASGLYNVCYVNSFQTQPGPNAGAPGEAAWWMARHPGLLLRRGARYVTDPGWPGEILLDTRTAGRRARIARIQGRWFRRCARRGFQAVEPDNLDSWTRSLGLISRRHNVALARLLVHRAHAAGLAIAQKNAAGLAHVGRSRVGFDFAVVEECQVYSECGRYTRAYGSRVYEIEYTDNGGRANFERACSRRGERIAVVYRDRGLAPRGSAGYVYDSC